MNDVVIRQPEFGRRLRELRTARGLSQRDLASGVVNPSYISLLESGSRVPTLDVVIQLSQVLDVPTSSLLNGEVSGLVPDDPRSPGSDLMWQILSSSLVEFGELDEARTRMGEAYAQARGRDRTDRVIEVGLALRQVLMFAGDFAAELDLLRELLSMAQRIGAGQIATKLRIDIAATARRLGRFAEAREQAMAALETITDGELNQSTEHVRLLGVLIAILCDEGDTGEVPGLLAEVLRMAEQLGGAAVLGRAHWAAATAYARMGRAEPAHEHLRLARRGMAGPTTSVRDWARFSRAAASVLLDVHGDDAEIERYLASAAAAVEAMDLPQGRVYLTALRARHELARGNAERAVELALSVLRPQPQVAGYDLVRLRLVLGRALHQLGRTAQAVTELRQTAELAAQLEAFRLATTIWRELDLMRS